MKNLPRSPRAGLGFSVTFGGSCFGFGSKGLRQDSAVFRIFESDGTYSGFRDLKAEERSPTDTPKAPIVSAHMCKRMSPRSTASCCLHEYAGAERRCRVLTRLSAGITDASRVQDRTRFDISVINAYPPAYGKVSAVHSIEEINLGRPSSKGLHARQPMHAPV